MYAARGVAGGSADRRLETSRRRRCDFQGRARCKLVLINPVYRQQRSRQRSTEGCLIFPNFARRSRAPKTVTIRAQDLTESFFEHTGEELLARAFLHETIT